jgi:hypothetical protein
MDANGHSKINVGWKETWDAKLHKIEEATTDEFRLSKYRCPCFYYCVVGRPILRSIIKAHLKKYGFDPKLSKLLLVHSSMLHRILLIQNCANVFGGFSWYI